MVTCRQEMEYISSESVLQILLKRIEDQDQKITTLETKANNLERKNSLLEEMITRSNEKQMKLEETIDNLKTEISKLLTTNIDTVKAKEENSDTKETVGISERLKDFDMKNDTEIRHVGVHGKPKQKRILTGGVSPSKFTSSIYYDCYVYV
jgi:predicted nuclease with TOPRIM domain